MCPASRPLTSRPLPVHAPARGLTPLNLMPSPLSEEQPSVSLEGGWSERLRVPQCQAALPASPGQAPYVSSWLALGMQPEREGQAGLHGGTLGTPSSPPRPSIGPVGHPARSEERLGRLPSLSPPPVRRRLRVGGSLWENSAAALAAGSGCRMGNSCLLGGGRCRGHSLGPSLGSLQWKLCGEETRWAARRSPKPGQGGPV